MQAPNFCRVTMSFFEIGTMRVRLRLVSPRAPRLFWWSVTIMDMNGQLLLLRAAI